MKEALKRNEKCVFVSVTEESYLPHHYCRILSSASPSLDPPASMSKSKKHLIAFVSQDPQWRAYFETDGSHHFWLDVSPMMASPAQDGMSEASIYCFLIIFIASSSSSGVCACT